MLPYPTVSGSKTTSGSKLIQSISQPIAGTRAPLLPSSGSTTFKLPQSAIASLGSMYGNNDPVQQPSPPPAAAGINYGSYVDPAIAQMQAMAAKAAAISARTRQEAQAEADAKRKEATIQYGDASGVPNIDAATAQAAASNPFSMLAALKRGYDTGTQNLEDELNKANLFYGGYRGQQLGQAATDYQQQRYDAGTRYQATMSDIQSALMQALLNADMMDMQAGVYGGGGGGGGGGDNGAGLVGRPGEVADLPVVEGWNPIRNSDAKYDITQATPIGNGYYAGPTGQIYDRDGRLA